MRNKLLSIILLFIVLVLTSCKEKAEKQDEQTSEIIKTEQLAEADVKEVSISIEGMTCEIGCARTIQSKLSKTEGVEFAKVNFEKKKGVVKYDANKVSEKQIVAVVEKIAGGDLYKVTEIEKAE